MSGKVAGYVAKLPNLYKLSSRGSSLDLVVFVSRLSRLVHTRNNVDMKLGFTLN